MSPLLLSNEHDDGVMTGQSEVLATILNMSSVDVIKICSLINKDRKPEYRIKIGNELSGKCSFYPLGIWGDIVYG